MILKAGVLFCSVSLMGMLGCGLMGKGARHEGAQVQGLVSQEKAAEALNLRLIRAGEDRSLPDSTADLHAVREDDLIAVAGTEIVFKKNIALPDPTQEGAASKPLFLVWEDGALGGRIGSAVVSHRLETEASHETTQKGKHVVLFDAAASRWYIPFSQLLSDDLGGFGPGTQHLLSIDLLLMDGTRRSVGVRFRVVPAVSHLKYSDKAQVGGMGLESLSKSAQSQGGLAAVQGFTREGWAMFYSRIANPTGHGLKIWVRAGSEQGLRVRTSVTHLEHTPGAVNANYLMDAPADIKTLSIGRGDPATTQRLEIKPDAWTSFLLKAGEEVSLVWLARPVGASVCPFPASTQYRYTETRIERQCKLTSPFTMVCPDVPIAENKSLDEPWSLNGVSVSGVWSGEIRVSSPEDTDSIEVARVGGKADDTFGSVPEGRAHSCQGYF